MIIKTVQELIEQKKLIVNDGYRAKNDELGLEGIPFARAGNINNGFQFQGADMFPIKDLGKAGNKISRPGDIVFTSKGTVGRFAFVSEQTQQFVYSPQLCFWRSLDHQFLNPYFLYYWMSSNEFIHQINAVKGQTDMADYVSLTEQKRMKVRVPNIEIQKVIGERLSVIDEQITLNNAMNETLEAMAKVIFKEWFIDFGPVKAKAEGKKPFGMDDATAALFPDSFEDSGIGPIPKGWELRPITDLFEVNPKYSLSKGKVYPYTEMKDLPTNASSVPTYIEREFNGGSKFSNGDTLIARITPCLENGKTAFVDYLPEKSIGSGSTEFIVIRSKAGIPLAASYLLARLDDFRRYLILNMSGTSGRQRVPESCLEKFKIAKPTPEIWKSFEKLILPIFQKIRSNSVENETLIKIRDLLLPKLISGEIQLSEVSID